MREREKNIILDFKYYTVTHKRSLTWVLVHSRSRSHTDNSSSTPKMISPTTINFTKHGGLFKNFLKRSRNQYEHTIYDVVPSKSNKGHIHSLEPINTKIYNYATNAHHPPHPSPSNLTLCKSCNRLIGEEQWRRSPCEYIHGLFHLTWMGD
jgi:hypothetical protein